MFMSDNMMRILFWVVIVFLAAFFGGLYGRWLISHWQKDKPIKIHQEQRS